MEVSVYSEKRKRRWKRRRQRFRTSSNFCLFIMSAFGSVSHRPSSLVAQCLAEARFLHSVQLFAISISCFQRVQLLLFWLIFWTSHSVSLELLGHFFSSGFSSFTCPAAAVVTPDCYWERRWHIRWRERSIIKGEGKWRKVTAMNKRNTHTRTLNVNLIFRARILHTFHLRSSSQHMSLSV